jgi:ribosome recycling factor
MEQEKILVEVREHLRGAVQHVAGEFATVHAGKATAAMVEGVAVEAYGTTSRLRDLASITTPDARTIAIQPWDRGTTRAIEKGILLANLGFTPIVDADRIRCIVPELSGERRQELAKRTATMAETGRVSVRAVRRTAMDQLRDRQRAGALSEDDLKRLEKEVQKLTDDAIAEINGALERKEKELLTV